MQRFNGKVLLQSLGILALLGTASCAALKGQRENRVPASASEVNYWFGANKGDGVCDLLHSKTYLSGMRIERDNANADTRNVGFDKCKVACDEFVKKHPAKCEKDAEKLVRSDVSCLYRLVNDVPPDSIPPVVVIQQDSKNCAVWTEPASRGVEVLLNELISVGEVRKVRGASGATDGVTECKRIWNKRTRCENLSAGKTVRRIFSCYGFTTSEGGERQFHDYLTESGLCNSVPCAHGIYTDGSQFYEVSVRLGSCEEEGN